MQRARLGAVVLGCSLLLTGVHAQTNWPGFGNDPGADRYSPLTQINTSNVDKLQLAWRFDTTAAKGAAPPPAIQHGNVSPARRFQFHFFHPSESEPVVVNDVLYMSTGFGHVVALNAETGQKIWDTASPHTPAMRGVSYWAGTKGYAPEIVYGTMDGFLVALDAKTGKLVQGFGQGGVVDLKVGEVISPDYPTWQVRSPPAIYKNYVIPGCFPGESPSFGAHADIRAFDLRTGKLVWTFHTVPRLGELNHNTWKDGQWENRAGVNNWGFISVDVKRGMLFVPLGSANKDFYGGDRAGLDLYGNSIVALDANTGKLKWYFQTVHHDNWDYDDCSAPILITVKQKGREIPAVAQTDKDGFMYILNRETGKPIYGVKEVPIKNDNPTPGDQNWPTEPVPVKPPPLNRMTFSPDEIATVTPEHEQYCKNLLALEGGAMTGGPFAQYGPKLRVIFPGWTGGTNWGGGTYDPRLGYIFIPSKDLGNFNKLVSDGHGGYNRVGPDNAPPRMGDYFWDGTKGWPCQQPPWGRLIAVNVNTGEFAWQVPLGSFEELDKLGVPKTGTPLMASGGVATAGGLIFIGDTTDGKFHALDERTGKELWSADLHVSINANPITWMSKNGKQYVAVMVGGTPQPGAQNTFLDVWALPGP
jgi:glucose dehydrogenase